MISGKDRSYFATPLIEILRPATNRGIQLDSYLRELYTTRGINLNKVTITSKNAGVIEPDKANQITDRLKAYMLDVSNGKSQPLLFTQAVDVTREEDKFPELKGMTDREAGVIAMAFGVPATLVNLNTSSWGSGIAEQSRGLWAYAARPYVQTIAHGISCRLLRTDHRLRFNDMFVSKGTLLDFAKSAKMLSALMSIEEIRRSVGLPSRPPVGEEIVEADNRNTLQEDTDSRGEPDSDTQNKVVQLTRAS